MSGYYLQLVTLCNLHTFIHLHGLRFQADLLDLRGHIYIIIDLIATAALPWWTCNMNAIGDYMPPQCHLYCFKKGWMDRELFVHFIDHFLTYIKDKCISSLVLLFFDGYSTHIYLEESHLHLENRIVIYCLLPNATHVMQAYNIGLFGPMKAAWHIGIKH